jgi:hypothetical protein
LFRVLFEFAFASFRTKVVDLAFILYLRGRGIDVDLHTTNGVFYHSKHRHSFLVIEINAADTRLLLGRVLLEQFFEIDDSFLSGQVRQTGLIEHKFLDLQQRIHDAFKAWAAILEHDKRNPRLGRLQNGIAAFRGILKCP